MNSDLSGSPRRRAKMPFLGQTLGRGPTKIGIEIEGMTKRQNDRKTEVACREG